MEQFNSPFRTHTVPGYSPETDDDATHFIDPEKASQYANSLDDSLEYTGLLSDAGRAKTHGVGRVQRRVSSTPKNTEKSVDWGAWLAVGGAALVVVPVVVALFMV